MTTKNKILGAGTIVFTILAILVYQGHISIPFFDSNPFIEDYKKTITKPTWYESANYVEINSYGDLQNLWSSKKRCCTDKDVLLASQRELFRSCHEAILRNPNDDQITFNCLYLQGNGLEKLTKLELARLGYEHFPNFKTDFNQYRCVNCLPADTYARTAKAYAIRLTRQTEYKLEPSLRIMEDVFTRRMNEVSPWMQVELLTTYTNFLLKQDNPLKSRTDLVIEKYNQFTIMIENGDKTLELGMKSLESKIDKLNKKKKHK